MYFSWKVTFSWKVASRDVACISPQTKTLPPPLDGAWAFSFTTALSGLSYPLKKWSQSLSCVRLFANPWTVAHQALPSMGFSRQVYWSGFPFPSPGELPNPGTEPRAPTLQADTLTSEPAEKQLPYIFRFVTLALDSTLHLAQASAPSFPHTCIAFPFLISGISFCLSSPLPSRSKQPTCELDHKWAYLSARSLHWISCHISK